MVRCDELRGGGEAGSGGGSGLEKPLEGDGPSCAGGLDCGGVSCCLGLVVQGGSFRMGRSQISGAADYYPDGRSDETPEYQASISDFTLDKFEVTVGRFRKFVDQYAGIPPASGEAAHPALQGSGWQSEWNSKLPGSREELVSSLNCSAEYQTWTKIAGENEKYPINCVSWYLAFAFCAWDNGRLPTEAEWEYAASGGEDRRYPWGKFEPAPGRLNYAESDRSAKRAVGLTSGGNGRLGHSDLAGSVWEWALDYYDSAWYSISDTQGCTDCANLNQAPTRVLRGGAFDNEAERLRAAARDSTAPEKQYGNVGFRCARRAG